MLRLGARRAVVTPVPPAVVWPVFPRDPEPAA
jgi:hypothetical protein